MVSNVSDAYALRGYVPLISNNFTIDRNGTNLLRKAAQLVQDIESLGDAPSFEQLLEQNSVDLNQLFNVNPQDFADFVESVKANLEENDKPLTVLNFIEAQNNLLAEDNEKDVDLEA